MDFKRTNGFTWPPDKAQIISWLLIIFQAICFYSTFTVSLRQPWSYTIGIVYGISFLVEVALILAITAINPGEEASIKRKIMPTNNFDRKKHKHVIENQFCNICQTIV